MTLLWHEAEPIGICVFQSPPVSLRQRNRYFGRKGKWTRLGIRALGKRLVMLSRVVLHPTWRGAGIAAAFVRRSCELCPWPWIEALAEMGNINPFFERAGFVRVGASASGEKSREGHSMLYGGRKRRNGTKGLVTRETNAKSRWGRPVYYVFDNRGSNRQSAGGSRQCEEGREGEGGDGEC